MLLASIDRLRAVPRLVEIARVLVHHGLQDLVRSVGMHELLDEATGVLGWRPDPGLVAQPPAQRVRLALEALGPAFVKLGQVLASRVDILGPDWIASLDLLHDRAPPLSFDRVERQLLEDLGRPVEQAFASFEPEAHAAGSIAQVHRARTPSGHEVAVKVRRPGVVAAIDADVLLLETLAAWWEDQQPAARRWQAGEIVRQLRKSLSREVDFAAEARSQQRFADTFRDNPDVVVPHVHVEYTRASLLVMDWVEGVRGSDMARLDTEGFDRQRLAAIGVDAILKMVLIDGFFHADPHPGNVFYLHGDRVALIDFGMVGWLSAKRRDELIDLLAAVAARDGEAMRDVLLGWAEGRRVSAERFAEDLGRLLHLYQDARLREVNLGTLLSEVAAIMREHGLALPPDLALLFKALITLEGLGTRLVPHFKLIEHVTPVVRRLLAERWEPGRVAGRLAGSAHAWRRALRAAPRVLESLAQRFADDGVALRFEVREIASFSRHLERSVNRATSGLVTAALIVGSSILLAASARHPSLAMSFFGTVGIAIAFGNTVWLIASIRRSRAGD